MDFILVHGAMHDGWQWHLVRQELERRGHRTWAPDLPAADPDAGAAEYARVVVNECAAAGPDAVVVGHSFGGLTIPIVASMRPVRHLVFLAASVPDIGRSWADQVAAGGVHVPSSAAPRQEASADPRPANDLGTYFRMRPPEEAKALFYHDCPAGLADEAVRHLRPQSTRPHIEVTPLAAWPVGLKVHAIHGTEDRCASYDFTRDVARQRLGTHVVPIPGGHSPFLARPATLTDVLLELVND